MAISFAFKCSYQNEVEYEVIGHPFVKRIEAYSECRFGLLDYQRAHYNGDNAEFERTMVARQGGVLIRYVDKPYWDTKTYWNDHRFPQDLYSAFVQWLKDQHAQYLVEHEHAGYGLAIQKKSTRLVRGIRLLARCSTTLNLRATR